MKIFAIKTSLMLIDRLYRSAHLHTYYGRVSDPDSLHSDPDPAFSEY